jgi:hypothetical protein
MESNRQTRLKFLKESPSFLIFLIPSPSKEQIARKIALSGRHPKTPLYGLKSTTYTTDDATPVLQRIDFTGKTNTPIHTISNSTPGQESAITLQTTML